MRRSAVIAGALVLGLLVGKGWGYGVAMETEEKLAADVTAYIQKHPEDGVGYFCLGRVHMTAWACRTGPDWRMQYGGHDEARLPVFPPWATVMMARTGEPLGKWQTMGIGLRPAVGGDVTAEAAKSLAKAVGAYQRAVELDGKNPRYQLALGCAMEEMTRLKGNVPEGFEWGKALEGEEKAKAVGWIRMLGEEDAAKREEATKGLVGMMPRVGRLLVGVKTEDAEVKARVEWVMAQYWKRQAVGAYRKAFAGSMEKDLLEKQFDSLNDARVSAEAGEQLLVLFAEMRDLAEKGEEEKVRRAVEEVEGKPQIGHAW